MGDTDFLEKASRVALTPGMDWSEQNKGTNAIGTALTEEEALTVHGAQHFMNANKALTCSCAPIFDPYGQVIGALDVTGDHRSPHQHTLALVRMSAQMIENHMFADIFPKAIRIHFHTRSEFLGTLVEGIAVFSPEGRFISANRSAQFQIGLPFASLKAHTFSSLFGIPVSALSELFGGTITNPKQLCLHNGVTVWAGPRSKRPAPGWRNDPNRPSTLCSPAARALLEQARGQAHAAVFAAVPRYRRPAGVCRDPQGAPRLGARHPGDDPGRNRHRQRPVGPGHSRRFQTAPGNPLSRSTAPPSPTR